MSQTMPTRVASGQRGKLYIAIVLLLAAIVTVTLRDRNTEATNNNNDDAAVVENDQPVTTSTPTAEAPVTAAPAPTTAPALLPKSQPAHASNARRSGAKAATSSHPTSPNWAAAKPAVQRVQMTESHPAQAPAPQYPMLAGSSSVQGAVLMQALIGADGAVQELRVISGPAILVAAARQAVQQWHFKPYFVDGKAMETQARVTVNFTIRVSDTEARYHVDSVSAAGGF